MGTFLFVICHMDTFLTLLYEYIISMLNRYIFCMSYGNNFCFVIFKYDFVSVWVHFFCL